jgi:hypothetical protein
MKNKNTPIYACYRSFKKKKKKKKKLEKHNQNRIGCGRGEFLRRKDLP